jgi:hypothetical protein
MLRKDLAWDLVTLRLFVVCLRFRVHIPTQQQGWTVISPFYNLIN